MFDNPEVHMFTKRSVSSVFSLFFTFVFLLASIDPVEAATNILVEPAQPEQISKTFRDFANSDLYRLYPWVKDILENVSSVFDFLPMALVCEPAVTVTSDADNGAGSLRQAIADICTGGIITFDGDYTINLTSGSLIIDKSLTIDGVEHTIVINGPGASCTTCFRVFDVTGAYTFNLLNLTVSNGNMPSLDWENTGGGIRTPENSTLNLTNVIFSNNIAFEGGAIHMFPGSSLTATNCIFSNNRATTHSGGAIETRGLVTITNCTFSDNHAPGIGGAISAGTLNVANSTFSDNSRVAVSAWITIVNSSTFASNMGGAAISGSTVEVRNSTISSNSAGITAYDFAASAVLYNTIVANSSSGANCSGNIENGGGNLQFGGSVPDSCGADILTGDPRLGTLGDYGGFTQTIPLLPGSAAIDQGSSYCPETDQRGLARPQPAGGACDVGAYEYVDTTAPSVDTFTVPTRSYTLNVPITSFTASDDAVVNGYMITTTSIPPAAEASGWVSTAPITYSAPAEGTYTLYPWAKDATGHVSSVFATPAHVVVNISVPDVATLVSPTGNAGTNTPAYTWNEAAGATWYHLWVNGSSGNIFKKWYKASAVCSSGTCSVTPEDLTLNSGIYTWWVRTWNTVGYGPWSQSMTFSVSLPPLPDKAVLISPQGSVWMKTPTYVWNEVKGASWYYLWVNGPSGNVIKKWYSHTQANCDGSTCSVTPDTALSAAPYTWWVRTWNETGYGPWSDAMTFSPTPPGKATLFGPGGTIPPPPPHLSYYTARWSVVPGATWYYVWVNGPSGNVLAKWFSAAERCDATQCMVIGLMAFPDHGDYTWWVRTWNEVGFGPWSDGMTFTNPDYYGPQQPTLLSPSGFSPDLTPTYSWTAVGSLIEVHPAERYYLWINGPSGNIFQQWYTPEEVGCLHPPDICTITPDVTLQPGVMYTWWIRGWNAFGLGPWSEGMDFTVP